MATGNCRVGGWVGRWAVTNLSSSESELAFSSSLEESLAASGLFSITTVESGSLTPPPGVRGLQGHRWDMSQSVTTMLCTYVHCMYIHGVCVCVRACMHAYLVSYQGELQLEFQ